MDVSPEFSVLAWLTGRVIVHKYQQYILATEDYEIANTSYGQVKGRKRKNLYENFGTYMAFEGMPYARKPLGELRFRAPQPPEPWSQVLDCTSCKSKPMQYDYLLKMNVGSEDCLYINVYVKKLKSDKPLPVMVWIYGGGFQVGEASRDLYAPDFIVKHDVVLVTFNYRLGVFGFLCMDDPELKIPGNAGLKDQVLALKWIKENIHNFNGDPNNITLFGESAGGASVHLLMLTPQAEGLFHKAIIQSGSSLCDWSFAKRHNYCYKLARHIGYTGEDNDRDVYAFFMQQSGKALTFKDVHLMTKEELMANLIVFFRPVIEPYTMPDCIADRSFRTMMPTAWANEIPLIIGINSFEGLLYYNTTKKYPFLINELSDLVNLLPDDVQNCHDSSQLKKMALKLKDVYFGGAQPNTSDHFYQYLDLMGHRAFGHAVFRTIRARIAYAINAPTFCYHFDFDSPFLNSFRKIKCGPSVRGVSHADDLSYLFHNVCSPKLKGDSSEYKCIQRMVGMWYKFALTSNPNCEEIEPTVWKPVTENTVPLKCLNISDEVEFKDLPCYDKLKAWDDFYTKAHKVQQYRLATSEYQIVDTNYGKIKGIKRKTLYDNDETYYAFEGIPYAKPPLGELRFRAPQPPEPWEGVLNCTTFKSMPMQVHFILRLVQGSEDCLHLNIYAKKLSSPKPLPVMVWIFGGGYQFGEASPDFYSPDFFMQKDVILVTLNYRLGVLGFLSFNDPDLQVPGNAGLKDQVMALKWIKENIQYFNGDPNNITVFGESAGAASCHYLMLSPRTKGLFHKAILQSGVALCPWTNTPQRDWAYRLACHIGYKGNNNDKEVYRYLAKQNASRLAVSSHIPLSQQDIMDHILFAFCPVVEPYYSEDCLISKPIQEYLPTAWGNKIPIIIGGTSSEGLFHYQIIKNHPFLLDDLTDCVNLLPQDINKSHTEKELQDMAHRLRITHFGNKRPGDKNTFFDLMDVMSYRMFWHSIHRVIRARQVYASQASTFCYVFDFDSEFFNTYRTLNCGSEVRGVCHADDVSYLFHNAISKKLPQSCMEYTCMQRMVSMWYNFALKSDPNCREISQTKWEPIRNDPAASGPYKCLNISEEVDFKELPLHEKLKLWDSFYTKEKLF